MLLAQRLELPNHACVSLEIENGKAYHLQGPNGSGKSLLLKSLAYLIPSSFERLEYQGQDIRTLKSELYRRDVLYVPSVPFLSMEGLVEDFMSLPLKFKVYEHFKPTFDSDSLLKKWNLTGKSLAQLSSGEKQLLSLSRALHLDAKILLLDEVTSHLSKERTYEVEAILSTWIEKGDRSLVWVSHQPLSDLRANVMDFAKIQSR